MGEFLYVVLEALYFFLFGLEAFGKQLNFLILAGLFFFCALIYLPPLVVLMQKLLF